MLNARQLALLDLLEQHKQPMAQLARALEVSGRTVLRDIDYVNFTLSGAAAITQPGNGGYQLEIYDRHNYFRLLQRHDIDDQILALLLIHGVMTRTHLADALTIPESIVSDKLLRLKQRFGRTVTLASRPNAGHFINEPETKRIVILANLIKKDPDLFQPQGITTRLYQTLRDTPHSPPAFSVIGNDYQASVLLAVYVLRNALTLCPQTKIEPSVRVRYDAAGLYLGENGLRHASALLSDLAQCAARVNRSWIEHAVNNLMKQYRLEPADGQLIDDLTGHITRCAASPVWLSESRQGSMNPLRAAWPVAFDLSIGFIASLRQQLDITLFDSDLIGLYFACALERNPGEKHALILLCEQNAIATINKMAIERELPNCRVIIVNTPAALNALRVEIAPVLVINNSYSVVDSPGLDVLTIKNIIGAAGISLIKEHLESALIRQKISDWLPAAHSFYYQNQSHENWNDIVGAVCEKLTARGQITAADAGRIRQRETEGDNLVINHVAVPHSWSEKQPQFRGYLVLLANPVKVNDEKVFHLLVACVSPSAREELKIFSYLASMLQRHDTNAIASAGSYEEFVALISQ